MTWIAFATRDGGRFAPAGLGAPSGTDAADSRGGHMPDSELLSRGSLLVETRLSPEGRPQRLFDLRRSHPWPSSISIQAIPGDGIAIILSQGDAIFHKVLRHDADGRTDTLRVTYSWDAPAKWGRLAIEYPENNRIVAAQTPPPPPLMMEDLRVVVENPLLRQMDSDMQFLAVSNQIEPLGPMPQLTAETPIATPDGLVPAGQLRRGDLVTTPEGDVLPVLHLARRIVPARGSFAPVRLRAPYFGLTRDIVTGSELRLRVGGSEVEYLFGTEAVLCPARHLVNGTAAVREGGQELVEYVHPVLPGAEALLCGGTAVESLNIGRLRRRPEALAASLLAGVPRNHLPEHRSQNWPVLKPFEAITLAENRAA